MKRRGLLLIILIGAIVMAAAALAGRAMGGGSRLRFPSCFSAKPEGLLAFERLLVRLGRPVETRTLPWDDLASAPAGGLLVVATPLQRPVDAREAASLRKWLIGGGSLMVVDDATTIESFPELSQILEEADLRAQSPLPEVDPDTLTIGRPKTRASRGTPAHPSGPDLTRITLHAEDGIRSEVSAFPLAIDYRGSVQAAEGSMGLGRIVRVQGPLLANDRILTGDNLEFALRLVDDLRGRGPILFDEYHHGYGGLLPGVRGLDTAPITWAGAQALLVVFLYALARGTRFGPARASREPRRRSSLEFVHSMASLYRTATARRHVIESALARFLKEARSRWSVPEILTLETLGRYAAGRSTGLAGERIAASLEAAQEALFKTDLSDRQMLARVRDLARLEEEVFGGR